LGGFRFLRSGLRGWGIGEGIGARSLPWGDSASYEAGYGEREIRGVVMEGVFTAPGWPFSENQCIIFGFISQIPI
ncbi:MAG: hypothetical protein WD490_10260, partial [Opitutales bacterium]